MEAKSPPAEPINTSFPVTLSIWEWHHLLQGMEGMMCIVNRDQRNTRVLYGKIASQLAGHTVEIAEPESKRHSEPAAEPAAEPPKDSSKTFLQRIFSN